MGKFDLQAKQELENLYQEFLNNELILKMKDIPMHRGSNCYIHSFKVCKLVVKKALKSKKDYHYKALITASILHDYYLYDWREHKELKKKHGRNHPLVAEENARRDFKISEEVSNIIKEHMWPLTPKQFPKTKEAKLVNYVDDVVASKEFATSKRYKAKRQEQYIKYISKLFED